MTNKPRYSGLINPNNGNDDLLMTGRRSFTIEDKNRILQHPNSGVSPLMLHPLQQVVSDDRSRYKVVVAGRRWGKTRLALVSLIKEAAKAKRRRVWYVAPSYRMAKQIMWDELKESIPSSWIYKINETELSIILINRSKIECKGSEDENSLRGVGLHYVVMDEFQDMKPDVWTKVLRPTLAKDRGHAMFIGTPKGYANLYDVYKLGVDERFSSWMSWQFPTITSPFIPESELEEARKDMDPKSFRQEFEASFETMSGRVYYTFDRTRHVGNYPFNPELPIWVGCDFNIDPMTAVILQPQPNGQVWCVDEIFLRSSNVLEVAEEIERRYWRHMGNIAIYPDPAGGARQHARGESSLDIFREKGFHKILYRKKHPMVQDRVNCMNRMFEDAKGESKLFIDMNCRKAIESLEQTLYREGTGDIDKAASAEHITDAMGYPIELMFPTKKIQIHGISI